MKFTSEYIAECRKARGGPWVFSEPREALAEIERLNSQLSARDALIERLIEAGSWLANLAIDAELRASSVWKRSRDLAENDWDKGVAEYRAMKGAQ